MNTSEKQGPKFVHHCIAQRRLARQEQGDECERILNLASTRLVRRTLNARRIGR